MVYSHSTLISYCSDIKLCQKYKSTCRDINMNFRCTSHKSHVTQGYEIGVPLVSRAITECICVEYL